MKHSLFLGITLSAVSLPAAVPTVTGVSFTQPAGQRRVCISYKLENAPAIVTVDIRTNGVSIGAENYSTVSGAVNRRLETDDTYTIVWRPEVSWAGKHLPASVPVDAVVTAWAPDTPPDYMVVELDTTKTVRYYVSTNALPGGLLANPVYRTSSLVMRRIHAKDIPWTMRAGNYPHTVTLSNDYYMGVFEFTQGQYAAVKGSYPSSFFTYAADRDMRPAEKVSYGGDLRGYSNGYWPKAPSDGSFLKALRTNTGIDFDLPSNAQWEFAARAGQPEGRWGDGAPYEGDTADANLGRQGRYSGNAGITTATASTPAAEGGTALVGSYAPNAWGLYDMHGNVWEWVLDGYAGGSTLQKLGGAVNIDPVSPDKTLTGGDATVRTYRGGAYDSAIQMVRISSSETGEHQSTSSAVRGFRVVCPIP